MLRWRIGRRLLPALLLWLSALPVAAFELALTLDDLPWAGPPAAREDAAQGVPRLIAALQAAAVPTTGFTVCATATELPALQQQWRAAGVEIGNHSASHTDYHRSSSAQWLVEVGDCQRQLTAEGTAPRYYRFPLLHSGDSAARRDEAARALQRLTLRAVPVSVDTHDWLLAEGYRRLTTPARRERAGALLVDHVLRSLRQARQTAQQRYGRDPAQILLLHANALVADHLPAVLAALREEGARFVSLERALADPVYALRDDYAGAEGLAWFYRTAPAQPERAAWDRAEAQRLRAALDVLAGDATTLGPAEPYAPERTSTLRHRGSDGRERIVHVWLPAQAGPAPTALPFVFALDGDYAFPLLQAIVQHYLDRGEIGPLAVVGLAHAGGANDLAAYRFARSRDYTPSHTLQGGYGPAFQAESGNAAQFRDVLLDELLPVLAGRYGLDTRQATYVGHSYGGLFGSFLLATRPDAFRRYVLVSPSLWYDDGIALRLLNRAPRLDTAGAPQVYLAAGGLENPVMANDLRRYAQALQAQGLPPARLRTQVLSEDTHNSIFPTAFTAALRWFEALR